MFKSIFYLLCIVSCFTYAASFAEQAKASTAAEFIIDTDVGIDDAIAILYLLNQPQIKVKAITIESDGNAHCKPAFDNINGLLALTHQEHIPLACGRDRPLMGQHHFPKSIIESCDNLGWVTLKKPHKALTAIKAKNLLIKTLMQAKKPLNILAIGPLTTIAEVLELKPQLKNKIRMIYLMGGAVKVAGNIREVVRESQNRVAEWNIYIDPLAANKVFHSGVPLTLIPLDVTNQALIDDSFYEQIKADHHTYAANFVYQLLKKNKSMIAEKVWYFWDPLAAVIATDEGLASFETLQLTVRLVPEDQAGATIIDKNKGAPIRVCTALKLDAFKAALLAGLNKT